MGEGGMHRGRRERKGGKSKQWREGTVLLGRQQMPTVLFVGVTANSWHWQSLAVRAFAMGLCLNAPL